MLLVSGHHHRHPPLASRASRIEITRTVVEEQQQQLEEPPMVVKERVPVRQRIGSRVIVAPPKLVEEEDEVDVPVSSVVTIKPRPVVARNRQANKNLLLRAMADAQKSMVGTTMMVTKQQQQLEQPLQTLRLSQKVIATSTDGVQGIKSRLGGIASKRQRSQINAIVSSLDAVVKRQKPNEKIIIEIGPNDGFSDSDFMDEDDAEQGEVGDDDDDEEERRALANLHARSGGKNNNTNGGVDVNEELEYVPKPIDAVPMRSKEVLSMSQEATEKLEDAPAVEEEAASNTQFVVTLDGAFKKTAAAGVRKRVEVNKRREVSVVEQQQPKRMLPPIEPKEDVGPRVSRVSSRNASAGMAEGNERAPPRPLVDLRQRVQEKRNGSPGNRQRSGGAGGGGGGGDVAETSPMHQRKRRSPIKFAEKKQDNGERPLVATKPETKKEEAAEVPQRKRIRITSSPRKDVDVNTSNVANGDAEPKSKTVVKEKERRDPKKYDNIPPRKLEFCFIIIGSLGTIFL